MLEIASIIGPRSSSIPIFYSTIPTFQSSVSDFELRISDLRYPLHPLLDQNPIDSLAALR
jgi:hypothetical protein